MISLRRHSRLGIWSSCPIASSYGPVTGPTALTLPAQANISRVRNQTVPASAPSGVYNYVTFVGADVNTVWSSGAFVFTKAVGANDELRMTNTGEEFGEAEPPLITHHSALITSLSPNPFNPTTAFSFKLQASSQVSLKVYDTTGRLVATLLDGWQEAGTHDVTFDGSNLSAGIYLYRLEAGALSATGKMALVK